MKTKKHLMPLAFLMMLVIFTFGHGKAQPLIQDAYKLSFGDKYRLDIYIDATNAVAGNPGENLSWNFSQLQGGMLIEGEPGICVDPALTPFADSTAVQASHFAVRSALDPQSSPYQYYEIGTDAVFLRAQGFYHHGSSSYGYYAGDYIASHSTLMYQDEYDFDYEFMNYNITQGYYDQRDSVYVEVKADAWGSLDSPAGSYQNVLRLSVTSHIHSWMRFDADEAFEYFGLFIDKEYIWLSPDYKVPVFTLTELDDKRAKDSFIIISYLAEYDSSTFIHDDVLPAEQALPFPNPVLDKINIPLSKACSPRQMDIFSAGGQHIISIIQPGATVDLGFLKPGLYLLQLQYNDHLVNHKFIKK